MFDDCPPLLQNFAQQLGNADEPLVLQFDIDDRRAAIDAEAARVARQLMATRHAVELGHQSRKPQPPEGDVLDAAGAVTRTPVILRHGNNDTPNPTACSPFGNARAFAQHLADNGSAWYLSGAPDERWDNDDLRQLGALTGADFEVVDASGLMVSSNSGAVGP